jgi:hypothetical protein
MGQGAIPNRPHLLVVPNSLVPQWTRELKTFFNNKNVEIHPVPTAEVAVETYLNSDAWVNSETPMILRILVCSHTVCAIRSLNRSGSDEYFRLWLIKQRSISIRKSP